ncbi:hypothetical protein K431DRAFT_285952 [Polychaeton citri CBS 116435]|uniref:YTH domain-containing protein n=1 Tax=Polychaeton citri CBS 116435 TaxID=1314669 RepID=A0A9P4Q8S5_9PEZI|nr:hypothetical protein K431DRAFT_285952 [Polychaeton citri CBS 116435]
MPYGYGYSPTHMQNIDPRYGGQPGLPVYGIPPNVSPNHSFQRSLSESLPVPSFPRGPPRKPKQSGHALWVGNLPPSATVSELKDHFSRDATSEIESVFLISKSNCAFVNYRTEAACVSAMSRFHDSRFGGVRLVCRLRRGSNTSSMPAETGGSSPNASNSPTNPQHADSEDVDGDFPETPTIVGGPELDGSPTVTSSSSEHLGSLPKATGRVPERYFVVKSLTLQDLEASVVNAVWATQSHNEESLNQAFASADSVYLIFSANKSGEYFGFARMASPITGEPVRIGGGAAAGTQSESQTPTDGPRSIATPPTATAPKGRIIDDSARGTIFWEAEHADSEGEKSTASGEQDQGQEWGKQFKVEWISTSRLPFYRTRGLRNPWNANREVKIARDGTELEPGVGLRLASMFHRPMPPPN